MNIIQKFLEKKNLLNKNRGFTLIELLVVIAIIGILSSILLTNINSAKYKAKKARFALEAKQIALALQLYYDKTGDWPNPWGAPGNYAGPPNASFQSLPLPPFVPEFYSKWDASYYCADCFYTYILNDLDSDGKPDCGRIEMNGSTVFAFKIPLCLTSACGSSCGAEYSSD